MGKPSTAAKNRYNRKAYDFFQVRFKAGDKQTVQSFAESRGESLNGYILRLIHNDMKESGIIIK